MACRHLNRLLSIQTRPTCSQQLEVVALLFAFRELRHQSSDPVFVTPYSAQANVGIEHLLTKDITVRADYLLTRGIHLPRTRNINLLPPVTLTTANAAALGFLNPTAQQLGRP